MIALAAIGGDPTALGWGTTFAYLVAFVFCLMVWVRLRAAPHDGNNLRALWLGLGLLLLFLGLNKESDFQTILVYWARDRSKEMGFYQYKRTIGLIFFLVTMTAAAAFAWWYRRKLLAFTVRHPVAMSGLGSIALYVFIRFAGIAKVEPTALASAHDAERFGFLEILGSILVCIAARQALLASPRTDRPW